MPMNWAMQHTPLTSPPAMYSLRNCLVVRICQVVCIITREGYRRLGEQASAIVSTVARVVVAIAEEVERHQHCDCTTMAYWCHC